MSSVQYQLEDLPEDVRDLSTRDLKELITIEEVLTGLRDSLQPARHRHDRYLQQNQANLDKIMEIKRAMHEMELAEQDLVKTHETEKQCHQQWLTAESKMYSKSRPYSRVGIENSLRLEIERYSQQAQSLRSQLISSKASVENVDKIAKEYLAVLDRLHYHQEMLRNM